MKLSSMTVAAILVVTGPALKRADAAVDLVVAQPTSIWLNGDSTLHPYASSATAVELSAAFETSGKDVNGSPVSLNGAVLTALAFRVPVTNMKSGEKGLDKNMYKALKATEYPDIRFEGTGKAPVENRSGVYHVSVPGRLTVSGTTKDVTIEADLTADAAGVSVKGSHHLLMSDFGVKPPVLMGLLRTRDAVTVGYNLVLMAPPGATKN